MGDVIPHSSRTRFDAFNVSLLSIFQFLTGENWNEALFEGIKESGSYWVTLYYLIVVIVGIFIVLNLFLELLLSGFNPGEPPEFSLRAFLALFGYELSEEQAVEDGDEDDDIDVGDQESVKKLRRRSVSQEGVAGFDALQSKMKDEAMAKKEEIKAVGGAQEIVEVSRGGGARPCDHSSTIHADKTTCRVGRPPLLTAPSHLR